MRLTVKYFAWMRERVGTPEETLDLPEGVATLGDLVRHLAARDEGYAAAFAEPSVVRAALDQRLTALDAPLAGAREVAFFPPMTGG